MPLLCAAFAALSVTYAYVLLDGFDLEVGAFCSCCSRMRVSRDDMVDSITPTWDGNARRG